MNFELPCQMNPTDRCVEHHSLTVRMLQDIFSVLLLLTTVYSSTKSQPTTDPEVPMCPVQCNCTLDKVYIVDCSQGTLAHIPSTMPNITMILNVSHNNLHNFSQDVFIHLPMLQVLDLSYNPHISLDESLDSFEVLRYLHTLDLQATGLHSIILTQLPKSLRHLKLGGNKITNIFQDSDGNQSLELRTLDIHNNRLRRISPKLFAVCPKLQKLHADRNNIQQFTVNISTSDTRYFDSVTHISLSHNNIISVNPDSFEYFPRLEMMDISYNNILYVDGIFSDNCSQLKWLSLAGNPIQSIPPFTLSACSNLTMLNLSGCEIQVIYGDIFKGLFNLRTLDISHNRIMWIHPETFCTTAMLQNLNLSYNLLTSLSPKVLSFTSNATQDIRLNENPWNCDCDIVWLANWFSRFTKFTQNQVPTCLSPSHLQGLSLTYLPLQFNCSHAQIINYTSTAFKRIGEAVSLDCVAVGDPTPNVVWLTPWKQIFHYTPAGSSHYELIQDAVTSYRVTSSTPFTNDLDRERIRVLPNGSLHIESVSRSDAGSYICRAFNEYGNSSVVVEVMLNYLIILEVTVWSVIWGVCCAGGMLSIGLLVGIIRKIHSRYSHSEKEKRKGIAQVLQNLNDYRSVQIGKLSAYKTAKLDQFSAFKNSKVDKLRTYKQDSFQSIVQHMHNLREHYTSQVAKVKDNCSQQVEKLREQYSSQTDKFRSYKFTKVGKLRGYKSAKVEKLRDQYTTQVLKIREYGSQQMSKLRDQYKLQQQHLLKLLELLDIGNCMGFIETECLRSDSMIFSENFINIDLETHPDQVSIHLGDSDNSEYVTASSQSDNSLCGGSVENVGSEKRQGTCNLSNQKEVTINSQGVTKNIAIPEPADVLLQINTEQTSHSDKTHKPRKNKKSQKHTKGSSRMKKKKRRKAATKPNCDSLEYGVETTQMSQSAMSSYQTVQASNRNTRTLAASTSSCDPRPEVILNISEHLTPMWLHSLPADLNTSSEDTTPNYSPTSSHFPSDSTKSSPEKAYIQFSAAQRSKTGTAILDNLKVTEV